MKVFLVIIIAVCLFSCDKDRPKKPIQKSTNKEIVDQFFDHFNKHDWQKMAGMYADTAEMKDPSYGKKAILQSRADIFKKYSELNQIFPDIRDSIIASYESGNHLTVEFISTGTGFNKKKFELPICTIFTIENGLITKDYTYFDNSSQ
ncbi:nuclear transport factor 2 family protein [Pedobacter sp. HMF7647]|uniref:Nuclear transport factor 2 family protein n=1 Tax=Hufsiella arboris TaxID=2695275 RepID=A0A7K1YCP3_9SPHI|nr:nuclear transport factor 2 family protein [Hufsiella arboris]MXV52353.1 nuclear transport factor 2 family protein [Hufsiella arboris]